MSIRVRPASPEDQAALSGLAQPNALARWDAGQTWVALDRAQLLGACTAGPSRDPDGDPWTAEIQGLSARADAPLAVRALWVTVSAELALLGARTLTCWVREDDAIAAALYAAQGARPDGATRTAEATEGGAREIRVRAPLPDEPFVRGLMGALDRADPAAARYLADEVSFAAPPCSGRDAVLRALAGRAAAPPGSLTSQVRESALQHLGADRWRINITERLRDGGHAGSYRTALVLNLPAGRPVTRVQALDLPGERAKLSAFMRKTGAFT